MFAFIGRDTRPTQGIPGVDWAFAPGLGTAWASNTDPSGDVLLKGSLFMVAGGPGNVATSPDGITWTDRPQLKTTTWGSRYVHGGVYNQQTGRMIIVGDDGGLAVSADSGITWTWMGGIAALFPTLSLTCICYKGSSSSGYVYLAAGDGWEILTSTDLITWTSQINLGSAIGYTGNPHGAGVWVGGGNTTPFVVVGDNGNIATADTLLNQWTDRTSTLATAGWSGGTIWSIRMDNITNKFLIVGDNGQVAHSPASTSGYSWTVYNTLAATAWGTDAVFDVAQMGTRYIAVGDNGRTALSTDLTGANWTYYPGLAATAYGASIAFRVATDYNGDYYAIVVGDGFKAAISPPA